MANHTDFRALEANNRRRTMVLVAVFILIFAMLGLGLDFLAGDLRVIDGTLVGFPMLTIAALIFAVFQSILSFYSGASLVLASVHASELKPDTSKHQMVLDVVNEMALAARMPVPTAYIMNDPAPNAFATGRDPEHSVICVTSGLVEDMDREEMQGVIGHEMAHIRDYDIRLMMMIAIMVGGIAMLADWFFWTSFFGGFGGGGQGGGDSNNDSGAIVAVIVILLAILAPLISQLISMAVSRQREYLADASSVEFTRNPRALLRALERIAEVESPLKEGTKGTSHLFMVSPLARDAEDDEGFFDNLFASHPPLGRRIARLRAMAGEPAPGPQPTSSPA